MKRKVSPRNAAGGMCASFRGGLHTEFQASVSPGIVIHVFSFASEISDVPLGY